MSDGITWDDAQPQQMGPPAALAGPAPPAQGITWDAAPQQQPGMLDQIGHQLGLTGRYALEGAGNLAGVVSDPLGQFLPGYQKTGELASSAADAMGLPKPQKGLEKDVAAAAKALVGTGITAGAGAAAAIPELAAQPGMQALSSMLGGGTTEATDSPLMGAAASLLPGGKALGSMAARGAARGSDPTAMQDTIRAFESAGTTPTVGQATQGGAAQALESMLAKMPGSAGIMARKAGTQADEIGGNMTNLADSLAPGSNPVVAGEAIQKGIAGEGGFVDRFKQQASQLYDAVDQHMPGDTPVPVRSTQAFLAKATTPIKGAESTSGVLANPKLQAIADALGTDTQNSQIAGLGANGALPVGALKFDSAGNPILGDGGTMPYQAVKALRTKVGGMIADAGLTSDVPRGQLKQLYGSLSDDLRAATSQNPEAFAANNRAENFYRQGMDQIDKVENVVGKQGGPEKVFQAAMSGTREGATTLNNVMSALQPEESQVVTSAVVRRMGRANPSAQNDTTDVFSTQTFLSNWAGMSPQAKQVLFDRMPDGFRGNMDQIAKVASNLREGSKVFQNSSGTAPASALLGLGSAVGGAIIHPVAAVPILTGLGTTNLSARLMTNPTFVKWLARNTTAPVGVLPAQIGYLDTLGQKQNDPDLSEAAQQLSGTIGAPQQ